MTACVQFSKYQPLTYNVMLVLLSFIITWGEVWFFDLRMIPLERKAREMWRSRAEESERTPLLAPSLSPTTPTSPPPANTPPAVSVVVTSVLN